MTSDLLRVIHVGVGGRGRWQLEVLGADPRFRSAALEFCSGAVCTYALTHQATVSDYHYLVQTERGGLRWTAGRWHFLPKPDRQLGSNPASIALESVPAPRSEQGVVDDWYRYITEGIEPGISGRNNLETLAVCEMVVRSATQRRTIAREHLDT